MMRYSLPPIFLFQQCFDTAIVELGLSDLMWPASHQSCVGRIVLGGLNLLVELAVSSLDGGKYDTKRGGIKLATSLF